MSAICILHYIIISHYHSNTDIWQDSPDDSVVKNLPAFAGDASSIPGLGKIPWRRKRQPTPVFLPGKFHGQRSLAGYSPWGCKESDVTERLTFIFRVDPSQNMQSYHCVLKLPEMISFTQTYCQVHGFHFAVNFQALLLFLFWYIAFLNHINHLPEFQIQPSKARYIKRE